MRAFIDVNIFMYAAGKDHPHREPSKRLLERLIEGEFEGVTDSEALQEILYRYWHQGLAPKGAELVRHAAQIVPVILPVEKSDALLAGDLLQQHRHIEPRDAVHAAVMLNNGMSQIYSYDRHFDAVGDIRRLQPT